jgi:hypothetical protein
MESKNPAQPKMSLHSRAKRFRMRAAECSQLADISRFRETKRIYMDLALSYEQLATHAEIIDEHQSAFRHRMRFD